MRTFFCYVLLLLAFKAGAQNLSSDFSPHKDYDPDKEEIQEMLEPFVKMELEEYPKKVRKSIKASFDNLTEEVNYLHKNHLLMNTDEATKYLEALLGRIVKANPQLKGHDFRIYTLRSDEPNASNRGNGIIFVNLGLLARFETEEDIAFILCHEIAHDLEEHVVEGVVRYAEMYYDAEYQKELKRINKADYNQLESYIKLRYGFLARFNEHTRHNELVADSIGFILYKKAGFNPMKAAQTIARLDSMDKPLYNEPLDLMKHFNLPDMPFKTEWLKDHSALDIGGNLDKWTMPIDSLKTHPDCRLRAEALRRMGIKDSGAVSSTQDGKFTGILQLQRFERIEMMMHYKAYDVALYNALHMLDHYPDNVYLHAVIAESLSRIYVAAKQHRFSEVVDFPSKKKPADLNLLLNFLHGISTTELGKLSMAYSTAHLTKHRTGNAYAAYVALLSENLTVAAEGKPGKITEDYQELFADEYYLDRLKELTVTEE